MSDYLHYAQDVKKNTAVSEIILLIYLELKNVRMSSENMTDIISGFWCR